MPRRKVPLIENRIYHIVSRSIAGYKVFRNKRDYERMKELFVYYRVKNTPMRYSFYLEIKRTNKNILRKLSVKEESLVEIIAYCLMPTHIHLVLHQICEDGISIYMRRILNSYTRYFNTKMKRKGPLWESRFKSIEVQTDEQLYHLTRYVHLNPVTARIVEKPEEWEFSSYKEFTDNMEEENRICEFSQFLTIEPHGYKDFVLSRIDYQRELAEIESVFLE